MVLLLLEALPKLTETRRLVLLPVVMARPPLEALPKLMVTRRLVLPPAVMARPLLEALLLLAVLPLVVQKVPRVPLKLKRKRVPVVLSLTRLSLKRLLKTRNLKTRLRQLKVQ